MNASLLFKKKYLILWVIGTIALLLSATSAFAAAGALDPTFGSNGIVAIKFNDIPSSASEVVLQTDGKIITLGSVTLGDEQSKRVITRYNNNGTVDTSFGTNGSTFVEVEGFSGSRIAFQPNEKLIVGGQHGEDFAVVRYNSNGTLDTSFGTNGMGIILGGSDSYQSLGDIAIQPDGKIVFVGDTSGSQSTRTELIYARFNSDGTEDIGNILYFSNSHNNYGKAVAIQPDGKIILSGIITPDDGRGPLLSLARINQDGSLDVSNFGTGGKVAIPFYEFDNNHSALAIQADGKIVLTGTVFDTGGLNGNLAVVRFNSNGALDTTFGGTGIVITDFGADESSDGLVIQPDGKILLEGKTCDSCSGTFGSSDFLLARYNSDGSLDTTFGENGKLISDFGDSTATHMGIALQPDNKLVVVGRGVLVRYGTGTSNVTQTTLTFNSVDAYDGWILESAENSSQGGSLDKTAKVVFVGDDSRDRQYRSILSFNTISIPDDILITSAQVKIKKQTAVGTDPFNTHGDLLLDIRGGTFSNNINLTVEDFSAIANIGSSQEKFVDSGLKWYTANLSNINLGFVNKYGVTQFRLLFSLDDNDDMGDDYIKVFSSGSATSDQPQLIVTYSTGGNVNTQPPVITSNGGGTTANIALPENTTAVTTVTATDPESQLISYSIAGGADAALFSINPSDGKLSFVTAPSYNAPNDAGLDHIYNVMVQASDGALTDSQELVISIINPNSSTGAMLDPTFGASGVVTTKISGLPTTMREIVLQPDGKIITLGTVQSQKIIIRHNSNGTVDTSFGANGSLIVEVPAFSGSKIAIQPDGKLIVGGRSEGAYAVVRYNSNGSLDTSFGINGITATNPNSEYFYSLADVVVQPDGKIVLAGDIQFHYGNHIDFEIVRFNSDGTLDVIDTIDLPYRQFDYARAVVIQPDNKIVISGDMQGYDGDYYIALARQNTNARPDKSTFGTNGSVVAQLDYYKSNSGALALQADGKIVVAGTIFNTDMDVPQNLALARFNNNGSLDTTFGGTGIVVTDFGANELADDLVIQASGKIIVAGTTTYQGASDFLLVCYNSDGTLDTSFGSSGKLVTDFGNSANTVTGMVQQSDGKVVVSGISGDNAILARYVTGVSGATNTTSFKSVGAYDGWILESGENSSRGGTLEKISNSFYVGDDAKDRQYRGILSFDTNSIPDNATITSAQLKIKKQAIVGTDPFKTHGDLLLEIRNGTFSNNIVLTLDDFSTIANIGSTKDKFSTTDASWYSASLSNINLGLVNKFGATQFRLLFSKDDNDDMGTDYIKFFSGNFTTSQPELFITYSTASSTGNQAPVIFGGSPLSISVPENATIISAVTALDPDGQPVTYSVAGLDAAKFSITPSTGMLAFLTPPDFESIPLGMVYHLTAQASDGILTATQEIAVTVTPVNEFPPIITSNGGGAVANISLPENTMDVTTIVVTDADLPAITMQYALGGVDGQLFSLDESTGKLSFVTAPSYNEPSDAGLDHIYNVSVDVYDGEFITPQEFFITITQSAIKANASTGFTALHQFGSQADNGRIPYGLLALHDGFLYGTTTYGGAPYDVPPTNPANKGNVFKMNMDGTGFTVLHEFTGGANDGWKPWSGLAISGNMIYGSTVYGGPRGEGGGVIYEMDTNGSGFRVLHAFGEPGDGFGGSTSPILVGDILYGVTRWGGNGTGTIYSYNTTTEVYTQLYRFAVNSSDGNAPLGTLTAGNDGYLYGLTWLGGNNNMGTLFRIKPNGSAFETLYHFAGGAQGKYPYDSLAFDGSHILYGTTLGEYGNNPSDLGTIFKYDITSKTYSVLHLFTGGADDSGKPNGSVILSSDGVTLYGSTHGDDAWGGTEFGILYQMNIDGTGFQQLYEFNGGLAGATPMRTPLLINGALYGMTAYGGTENYGLIYRYQVSTEPISQMSFAAPNFNIYNPVITSSAVFSISENSTAVTTVTATDADLPAQSLTYSITGGADSALFNVNSATGELNFIAPHDFEIPTDAGGDNIYNFTLQASDGELVSTQDISVTVNAVNDNTPIITSTGTLSILENSAAVTSVTATDADLPTQSLAYSISGGSDSMLFSINLSTGELTFIAAPDYEMQKDAGLDNIYNVTVQASDGAFASTQDISVTVTPVNDNIPIITSPAGLSIYENTTAITTITATDSDLPAQTLIYSIIGGADSPLFTINSSTGSLAFVASHDYEIPNDVGVDNIYNVTVQASDGTLNATQNIAIGILPVNDNSPAITSLNSFSIPENTSVIATLTAIDADRPSQPLTYSIISGLDALKFSIVSASGELKFITVPDFEVPTDFNLDNIYEVVVQVSDGIHNNTQHIVTRVTNAD
jgi:uncharacterized delta-60 repeat protein